MSSRESSRPSESKCAVVAGVVIIVACRLVSLVVVLLLISPLLLLLLLLARHWLYTCSCDKSIGLASMLHLGLT